MRLASKDGIGYVEKQAFRALRVRKRLRQFLKYRPGMQKMVLFIVGCQRSGTTLIHHLFRLDLDTITYDEYSPLSQLDRDGLRLDPREVVQARIAADRAPLVVTKPLVESQNVRELLDWFPAARAIWIYRDFRDVAVSNIKHFGTDTGHRDLAPILAGDQDNWRAQNMASEDIERIRSVYTPDLAPHDAAALFWWARNRLWFSRALDQDSRIALCSYDDLVGDPGGIMKQAYGFIGRPYPGERILEDVFATSKGRGRDVVFSSAVRSMCLDLQAQLAGTRSFTTSTAAGDR